MSALSATQISQKRRSFGSTAPSLPRGTTRILLNLGRRSIFDCSSTLQMFFVRSLMVLGFVSPAHTQMLFTLPEVVELPTSIVPNCTPYSLLFAHRLHVIWVTTV